jgi:alpha-tubulin suppressor-like RCC1 family protein
MNKSPGIKKWRTRCAIAAALILIVLLVFEHQLHAPGIRMGKPLPQGKVRPQLVNAGDIALLLAPDGSLWAWGGTQSKLAWNGTGSRLMGVFPQPSISEVPLRVGADSDWTQVASGGSYTVALKSDGSLWAWGWNGEGEVGQANLTNHYGAPTRIGRETNWTQICAGVAHTVALKIDGSLWAWGFNNRGQLGDGTTNNISVPSMIGVDRDWQAIAAHVNNTLALKRNGTIWRWGSQSNSGNELLTPTQMEPGTNWQAISAYDFNLLALKTDGTLWLSSMLVGAGVYINAASAFASGHTDNFTQVGRDQDWIEIHAGWISFFARKNDGSWWGCGLNYEGQLGLGTHVLCAPSPRRLPFSFEPWVFAPGQGTTLLLGLDGKLWTWGRRLGLSGPSATRQKFEAFLAPAVKRFPAFRFLIKSDIDQTPHLLWELPPEVRRSLGTGPNGSTNDPTTAHPAGPSHE